MLGKMDLMLLNSQTRLRRFLDDFKAEEKGASDMVAIMVVIVIIIAVAGVFNEQLKQAVTDVFSKLTNFINSTS